MEMKIFDSDLQDHFQHTCIIWTEREKKQWNDTCLYFYVDIDADDDSVQDEDSAAESDSDEGNEDRQVRRNNLLSLAFFAFSSFLTMAMQYLNFIHIFVDMFSAWI